MTEDELKAISDGLWAQARTVASAEQPYDALDVMSAWIGGITLESPK